MIFSKEGNVSQAQIHVVFQVINFLYSEASAPLKLSDSEKLLLINLASHKGTKGIYPSVRTIARELKKGESSIRRFIAGLKKKGLITVDSILGKSNHYTILNLSTTPLNSEKGIETYPSHFREDSPLNSERGTPLNSEKVITKGNNNRRTERGATDRRAIPSLDFLPNEESTKKIQEMGFERDEALQELARFIEYYRAKGEKRLDWNLAVVKWFERSLEYARKEEPKDEIRSTVPWYGGQDPAQKREPAPVLDFINKAMSHGGRNAEGRGRQKKT